MRDMAERCCQFAKRTLPTLSSDKRVNRPKKNRPTLHDNQQYAALPLACSQLSFDFRV
jgi:hypothetical protein